MREKQAKASRAKIIKTTFKLFDKYGSNNVSIGDICKAAKISSGTLYHYFSSKDQLVVLYVRKPLHEMLERTVVPEIGKKPTKDLVLSFISGIISSVIERGVDWSKTYYISSLSLGKNDSFVHMLPYTVLHSILEKGIELGEISDKYDADFYTDYLFSLLNGATIGWNQQDGETDLLLNGTHFFELAYESIATK